jgi:hypothetical protein
VNPASPTCAQVASGWKVCGTDKAGLQVPWWRLLYPTPRSGPAVSGINKLQTRQMAMAWPSPLELGRGGSSGAGLYSQGRGLSGVYFIHWPRGLCGPGTGSASREYDLPCATRQWRGPRGPGEQVPSRRLRSMQKPPGRAPGELGAGPGHILAPVTAPVRGRRAWPRPTAPLALEARGCGRGARRRSMAHEKVEERPACQGGQPGVHQRRLALGSGPHNCLRSSVHCIHPRSGGPRKPHVAWPLPLALGSFPAGG